MKLGRKEQCLILFVVAIVLFTVGYQFANHQQSDVELVDKSDDESTFKEAGPVVHVDGAVEKPGLYKLPPGSRVDDAIKQAVPLPDADISSLNLAALLKDGQKLIVARKAAVVPEQGSVAQSGQTQTTTKTVTAAKAGGLVNINTAGVAELDTLPGIGPALAERIVQYRQANGTFQSVDDLKNVSGIGDKKFSELQDKVTVQ